mmetsp:Transcript_23637/g.71055  ORF Transcript_23637/g.71055 Transcript_23637/m.71055 type:complete len:80 (-) Transcript_23637:518-757(-)
MIMVLASDQTQRLCSQFVMLIANFKVATQISTCAESIGSTQLAHLPCSKALLICCLTALYDFRFTGLMFNANQVTLEGN